jgi:4-hydroxyphenylpyruvate dioxygenase
MVDRSGDGVLLQIFMSAVADRPTLFFEVIQRIGCETVVAVPRKRTRADKDVAAAASDSEESSAEEVVMRTVQAPACGGFGKGNAKELYASMERHDACAGAERTVA